MDIEVSPDQLWFYPLGTKLEDCRDRIAVQPSTPDATPTRGDGVYDGMYVEAFGSRWLATITVKDGVIFRQTLMQTVNGRGAFKKIYGEVRKEFGRGARQGMLKATGYVWDYMTAQLILTLKETAPLTGIFLILTAKK